jgi:CheY-like chemotaxis protein
MVADRLFEEMMAKASKEILSGCNLSRWTTLTWPFIAGEAGDGKQALQMMASCQPDVIILDFNMP